MKKIGLFVVVLVVGIFLWVAHTNDQQKEILPKNPVTKSVDSREMSNTERTGVPTRLIIPKIGVNASVESVGMDEKGNMDVPKKDENVAWFQLGYKVGIPGNTVLAGHLDTQTGAPAVFFDLKKLAIGDTLQVISENNETFIYTVTDTQTYEASAFPLREVFGPYTKNRLNLITCEGRYTSSAGYSHRVVVYSELTNIE